MVLGGRKPNHSRGNKFGNAEDLEERSVDLRPRDEDGGAAEEGQSDEEKTEKEGKAQRFVLERDEELEADLMKQFGDDGGLTRKQREEIERQEKERREQKELKEGKSDEAKAELERLAEVRRRREEAAKQKAEKDKADAAAKAAGDSAKADVHDSQREVAKEVARLVRESKDGKMTLRQLNQDATCKKVLKPLCKKEGVKAINKAWLERYSDLVEVKPVGSDLEITPKGK